MNSNQIGKLNFDCLLCVASYLNYTDLESFKVISKEFNTVAEYLYDRYKEFDFKTIAPTNSQIITSVLKRCGVNLKSLTISYFDLMSTNITSNSTCSSSTLTYFSVSGNNGSDSRSNNTSLSKINSQIDETLHSIGFYCTNLESIYIDGITLHVDRLKNLKVLFNRLCIIEFVNCDIEDGVIMDYLKIAVNLKRLNLSSNFRLNGNFLIHVKNLNSLNLCGCIDIKLEYFTQFCLNNKNLNKLNIDYCTELVTDISAEIISKNLCYLNDLSILTSSNLWNLNGLCHFSTLNLRKIKFGIVYSKEYNKFLNKLANKDLLQHIEFCVDDKLQLEIFFPILLKFNNLQILKLNNSMDLTDERLMTFSKFLKLKELYIENSCKITVNGVVNFVSCSLNLCKFNICGCTQLIANEFFCQISPILIEQKRINNLLIYVSSSQMTTTAFPCLKLQVVKHFK